MTLIADVRLRRVLLGAPGAARVVLVATVFPSPTATVRLVPLVVPTVSGTVALQVPPSPTVTAASRSTANGLARVAGAVPLLH